MAETGSNRGGARAPLHGVRVVAVEQYMSGPYCSMLLADAGAEVIKIELPRGGDPRRSMLPFATDEAGNRFSGGFMAYNRNKASLALYLRKPEGRDVLRDLVRHADVLVENLRPGAMDELGVGYAQLREVNPRLIYAAISGFGRMEPYVGPYSGRPAMDVVVEAMSGIMHTCGFEDREPTTTVYAMPDIYSGLVGAYSIALALVQRSVTGEGQFLDISMYDCMLSLNERSGHIYSFTGQVPMRGREMLAAPRGAFKAKDGYVAITNVTDEMWRRLATLIGREDLITSPDTATGAARAQLVPDIIRPVLEKWLADKTREEATQLRAGAGVPGGPVQTMEDVFRCPQVEARKMLIEIDDPVAGRKKFLRTPVMGSGMASVPTRPAPRLGQQNEEILKGLLGYDEERIARLRESGVLSAPEPMLGVRLPHTAPRPELSR